MDRRESILALIAVGAAAVSSRAHAQTQPVRRIGLLQPNDAFPILETAFRKRLAALGWVEGKNLVIEYRHADSRNERMPALAAELVALKVEVIVTNATPGTLAAKAATSTIPIVFTLVSDPVGSGAVASLGRPGGNVTGIANLAGEIAPKQLELLKDLLPKLQRVAFMRDPSVPGPGTMTKGLQSAAERAGLALVIIDVRTAEEIEPAFATAVRERATAMILAPTSMYATQATRIAELAQKHRIATAFQARRSVAAGGLVSYGADGIDGYSRTAVYVDKILRGAKPGDLPVEQADRFVTIINKSTAKALGITIPQSVLVRVDEVIE